MCVAYMHKYGSMALLTRSRLPFTKDMILHMVSLPVHTRLDGVTVGSRLWISLKAIICTAAATGMRQDECTAFAPGRGGRDHLRWRIKGVYYNDLSTEQLKALGPGDAAVVVPVPSKADRSNVQWGNKLIYLPWDDACQMNAAKALRDMELAFPVSSGRRAFVAMFPKENVHTSWSGDSLYRVTKSLVSKVVPAKRVINYSFHSFRIYLACALMASGKSTQQIQTFLRWKSSDSVPIYARMNANDYETTIRQALLREIDSRQATTLPDIGGDESFNAVLMDELREAE